MYEDQTEALIKQRMLSKAPIGINTGEGDFFNDAISPAAIELTLAYQQLDRLLELGFVDTAYGEYLDKLVSQSGLTRKPATKGTGQLEVVMTPGAVINAGDVFATRDKNIKFVATETKTVGDTGKILIDVENNDAGNFGNILTDTAFIVPISIPGFISAKNLQQINAGMEQESNEALRSRYFEKVRTPATSGNKYHYRNWAKEVPGVGDAKVFPLWNGPNSVKVVIIDSNKQPASASIVSAVQQYIDPGQTGRGEGQAPIGAVCTVESAAGLEVNISATISGANPETVKPLFEEEFARYLAEIAFTDNSVSYTRIASILLECVSKMGGSDCPNLKVNNGVANIQPLDKQVAVKGTVTLT